VSEENIEVARRWYAALPDLTDRDGFAILLRSFRDYVDEEGFELHLPSDYPEDAPVFKGRDALEHLALWLREAWAEWRFEPERFIDAGDQVVVCVRLVARSRSGVPVELPSAHVLTIHDGRLASTWAYRHQAEALKAVGLEQ
jgi:ketosteroid isomerase-like protein